ncbi:MAG: ArsR family transcriptional regulator [bacterium]|nr:ArsR family transcriptional regulator [bacterium]
MKNFETLERITKGFASKRRVAMLTLLEKQHNLDTEVIAERVDLGYKTTAEHLRKMHLAGLITKKEDGYFVLHKLTPRGRQVLSFLRRLR